MPRLVKLARVVHGGHHRSCFDGSLGCAATLRQDKVAPTLFTSCETKEYSHTGSVWGGGGYDVGTPRGSVGRKQIRFIKCKRAHDPSNSEFDTLGSLSLPPFLLFCERRS